MNNATGMVGATAFCEDGELGYAVARRRFQPGEILAFDASYRLAHLPLVAPGHPDAIREIPGAIYRDGRYPEARHALVAPVAWAALAISPPFQALEQDLRASSFAAKIAWELGERRRSRLHATIAGGVRASEIARHVAVLGPLLSRLGRLRFRLAGPFVGNRNWGRIYLPAYPQRVEGGDPFALMQDAVGAPRTGFYGVGLYHLADPLTVAETADLACLLDRWQRVTIAELELPAMVIHATNDDLVLSGRTVASIVAS